MRLLRRSKPGEFSFSKDFVGNDTIPPYAILSHTWGADTTEVTFEDLRNGIGKEKPGYEKIRFCGEQAGQNDLEYFWVDTCCINKANLTELSEAINSMFRWYRNATRCYVYLSDVSSPAFNTNEESNPRPWESDFRKSRWFTRGWTLQELLAPASVEFFSQERKRLGDKRSLERQIHEITGIANLALRGTSPSKFSVDERFSWVENRQTKIEEDKAYSLLGIFDVHIPLIYGEGREYAFKRLREEINKPSSGIDRVPYAVEEPCLRALRASDPRVDKDRIELNKDKLLKECYSWILENPEFRRWRDSEDSRLLWIKGDPGKGKTMMMIALAEDLSMQPKTQPNTWISGALRTARRAVGKGRPLLVSYFFCQSTDSRLNNAASVLKGLIYLIVQQRIDMIRHVRKRYEDGGSGIFDGPNAVYNLRLILLGILGDSALPRTYLLIDALDECNEGLLQLLDTITDKSFTPKSKVMWLVASRNRPDIAERLRPDDARMIMSLELNAMHVTRAVSAFVDLKVHELAKRKLYDAALKRKVKLILLERSEATFLWVALVCQNLEKIPRWNTLEKLNAFPPGLGSLYQRMMEQISNSDNADLCKQILALTATVYRPITLRELTSLVKMLEDMSDDLESLREVIGLCGSFLTIREGTIYFVHQSAKDYLLTQAFDEIFPSGREEAHYIIFSRSLHVMSKVLRRDIYSLRTLGYPIERVELADPDPLVTSRYSCIYWVNHLCDWNINSCINHRVDLQDGGVVDVFIRKKYLYWLEALSLCRSMSDGLVSLAKLEALVQRRADTSELIKLVRDARRFIMYHKGAIENSPLQAYASALLFSPVCSLIRVLFKEEEPKWITIRPTMGDEWSACLQTLEGHRDRVYSVAFSHNSAWLASSSGNESLILRPYHSGQGESCDTTVKIWDASSGECLQTLEGHRYTVSSVAFSHDSTRLASASSDKTVKIWDASSGECLQTLEGHRDSVYSVAFSHDSARLASASLDKTVKIWDASSGECLQTLEGHRSLVSSVAFSHDSARLASVSLDETIKIWNASSGECLQTLEGHSHSVNSVAFSHDSARLASASRDKTVKIWDASSGECLQTLEGHRRSVFSVAFSHNSTRLASASDDNTVKIWDASSGECLQTLEGHCSSVYSVAVSHDSARLASASLDKTVKIWDASSGKCLQTLEGHRYRVHLVAFSHDSARLASASLDETIKIWNASSGECLQTLEGRGGLVYSVAFSHDSARLASASLDKTVEIWDVSRGECLQTLEGHRDRIYLVAFSHDSARLASASLDETIKIWDVSSGECLQTLKIRRLPFNISFDTTGSCLHTEVGTFAIDASTSNMTLSVTDLQSPRHQGWDLSSDKAWITYNLENLVWLPSEYRPSCSAVSGKTIGVGVGSGKVWTCNFKVNDS